MKDRTLGQTFGLLLYAFLLLAAVIYVFWPLVEERGIAAKVALGLVAWAFVNIELGVSELYKERNTKLLKPVPRPMST
jgi:thiol:disulfide interchange protein